MPPSPLDVELVESGRMLEDVRGASKASTSSSPANLIRRRPVRTTADTFSRTTKVSGKIISGKHVGAGRWCSNRGSFVVVKGIRGEGLLANIFFTQDIGSGDSPVWDEPFQFECPSSWGMLDLTGLKFLVYGAGDSHPNCLGSEHFLGGADVDVQDLRSNVTQTKYLELYGGASVSGATGKRRRGRLRVEYSVVRKAEAIPPPLEEKLTKSMEMLEKVVELDCRIRKAKNLPKSGMGSYLQCVVRVVLAAGVEQELHCTTVVAVEKQETPWDDERFRSVFGRRDDPVFLVFDVYTAAKGDPRASGSLHGSAFLPLTAVSIARNKHKLILYGQSTGGESGANLQSTNSRGRFNFSKRSGQRGKEVRGVLTVDLGAKRCEETMPHVELLHEPFIVANEEDVDLALEDGVWQTSSFGVPPQLIAMQDRSMKFRPALVSGVNSIVFICGIIHGATGLRKAANGRKSDACCVVEAASGTGDKILIHRTRCIQNRLYPRWNEAFHFIVPGQMEVDRLTFTIIDGDIEDLGLCEVDLSLLPSGEGLIEEKQLERDQRNQVRRQATFLRSGSLSSLNSAVSAAPTTSATVSYEVSIERRVKPVFQDRNLSEEDARVPPRHLVTQTIPGMQAFVDPSQWELEASSRHAARVHQLCSSGQLGRSIPKAQHATTYGKWLRPRGIDEQHTGMGTAKDLGRRLAPPLLGSTDTSSADTEQNPWLRRTISAPVFNPAEDRAWNTKGSFRPRFGSETRNATGRVPCFLNEAGTSADTSLRALQQTMPPAWLGLGTE